MMFGGKAGRPISEKERMETALANLLAQGGGNSTAMPAETGLTSAATPREAAGLFGGGKAAMPSAQSQALQNVLNPQDGLLAPLNRSEGPTWRERLQRGWAGYVGGVDGVRQFDRDREQQAFADHLGSLVANTDPKGADQRQAAIRTLLTRHAARGHDISQVANYLGQGRQDDAIAAASRALPTQLQPFGQLAPNAGAAFMFGQHENTLIPGRDGAQYRGNLAGGPFEQVIGPQGGWDWMQDPDGSVSPRPGGPADPAYLRDRAFGATSGEVAATPRRPVDPPNQSQVIAGIIQKAQRGEPLNEWEQRIMEAETAIPQGPMGMFPMMGLEAFGNTGAPARAQGGAGRGGGGPTTRQPSSGGVARPQTEADFAALPRGARYIDPDDGQLYEKQ